MSGEEIAAARERPSTPVRVTPILPLAPTLREIGRERLLLKAENLQVTGSYKARAAFHFIDTLDENRRSRGVVLSSSGNFAQAFAYASAETGVPVTVVMPGYTAETKIRSTREYGAEVVICKDFADREPVVERVSRERGMVALHTFENPEVIVGHGAIGFEILDQVPDVETILVPVSSGGLAAGIAVAVKSAQPRVRVIGVQPRDANAAYVSWRAGKVLSIDHWKTMADALSAREPGKYPFMHLQEYLDDIVLVSEESIAEALRLILLRTKTVAEPGGATAAAAFLSEQVNTSGITVAIVSGGNVDPNTLAKILPEEIHQ